MKNLDLDSGLAAVVEAAREAHDSVWPAVALGKRVDEADVIELAGKLHALLNAIDARLPQPVQPAVALKAVA